MPPNAEGRVAVMEGDVRPADAVNAASRANGIGYGTHRLAARRSYSTSTTRPPGRTHAVSRPSTTAASGTKWSALASRIPSSLGSSSPGRSNGRRSEEHTSELQSQSNLVCRLLLEKKNKTTTNLQMPHI